MRSTKDFQTATVYWSFQGSLIFTLCYAGYQGEGKYRGNVLECGEETRDEREKHVEKYMEEGKCISCNKIERV